MRFVLDTNIVCRGDWLLTAPRADLLSEAYRHGIALTYMPELVLDELVHRYKRRTVDDMEKISRQADELNQRLPRPDRVDIRSVDPQRAAYDYRRRLLRRIESLNIHLQPYPSASHQNLAVRAMQRRRPFRASNKNKDYGYRDALIWETIIDLVRTDPATEVLLITNNAADFGEKIEGRWHLHPDLKGDLEQYGVPPDLVQIATSLREAVGDHLIPHLPSALVDFDVSAFNSWFDENKNEVGKHISSDIVGIQLPRFGTYYEDPPDIAAMVPLHCEKIDSFPIGSEDVWYFIDFHCIVDVTFLAFPKGGLLVEEPAGKDDVRESVHITLPVGISIGWDPKTTSVKGMSATIEDFIGWCSRCRYPMVDDEPCGFCGGQLLR